MNLVPGDPVRLMDQRDQPQLVERIAGQAARDLADPPRLSSTAMARIAVQVDAARMQAARTHEPLRFGWVLVMGAFLLGIVTAASAAHLDLLPRWITPRVQDRPKLVLHRTTPGPAKAPRFARNDQPSLPATAATPAASPPSADPIPEPAPVPVPAPIESGQVAADRGVEATRQEAKPLAKRRLGGGPRKPPSVAMRDPEPGTPSVPTGHPLPLPAWPAGSSALPPAEIAAPPLSAERRPPEQQGASPSAPPHQTVPVSSQLGTDMEEQGGLPTLPATARPERGSNAVHATARENLPATVRAERSSAAPHASMYLKEIVRALRIDHSPSQALALLDRNASELAGSAFAEESLLLRVEAMLALGQRSAVLRLLDGTSLTDVAASRGLLITRAELRAATNRCAEAIGDFDLVLAEARRPPKQALLGRALCKQKLGDTAGANADFDRYRREFPDDPLP